MTLYTMSSQVNVVHLSSQWERLQWAFLKSFLKRPVSLKQDCWLGQLTFDRVKNFLNSLWLIAVWSAARCDLQHVIRTVLCEELQGRGEESQKRGLWLAEAGGRASHGYLFVKRQKHFLHLRGTCSLTTLKRCFCSVCAHLKYATTTNLRAWEAELSCAAKSSQISIPMLYLRKLLTLILHMVTFKPDFFMNKIQVLPIRYPSSQLPAPPCRVLYWHDCETPRRRKLSVLQG